MCIYMYCRILHIFPPSNNKKKNIKIFLVWLLLPLWDINVSTLINKIIWLLLHYPKICIFIKLILKVQNNFKSFFFLTFKAFFDFKRYVFYCPVFIKISFYFFFYCCNMSQFLRLFKKYIFYLQLWWKTISLY